MSDDDAPEREFDLAHFPADSRNYAAELAQLQEQEMKHMAGLKKVKDEAERAAAIKDYKQVVTMQRFMIMNEMKVAVKVAKQKNKASKGGGKSDVGVAPSSSRSAPRSSTDCPSSPSTRW